MLLAGIAFLRTVPLLDTRSRSLRGRRGDTISVFYEYKKIVPAFSYRNDLLYYLFILNYFFFAGANIQPNLNSTADLAAARRAIGTLNGEQLT